MAERALRVLRVITRLNVGGPARHVAFLQRDLARYGIEQTVACGRLGPGEDDLSHLVERAGGDLVRVEGLGRRISPLSDLQAFCQLFRLCRSLGPDLVHTHTAKAGALGRVAATLAGVPLRVHTFHGHVLEGYFGPLGNRAVRIAERTLSAMTDRIVALSARQAADLTGRFRVAPAGKVRVVPLGIDRAPFAEGAAEPGTLRAELGLSPGVPLVGWVGRLVPVKDPVLAARAFAALSPRRPAPHLVLCGDGPLRQEVEAAVRRAQVADRVHLLGNRRDMPEVLRDLDLLLLSSRSEGTPLALIEGLAAGVPAVATAVGGVGDLAPGVDVIRLVPPGDAAALTLALDRALQEPDWRRGAGAGVRARTAAHRFDRARLAKDLAGLYAELLRARPALRGLARRLPEEAV